MLTEYKFNGKELDSETGMYYYGARYYIPELSIWGSVDPLSDKYPSMSPFMYCAGNPVRLVDPNGMDIDPTASGYKDAEKASKEQPEFGKLFNAWKNDNTKCIKFNLISGEKGGYPGYEGNDGQDVYTVNWDPNLENELGTSGIYEESFHLDEAIKGVEMAFKKNSDGSYGMDGKDIYDEIRAKEWVANNIKIKTSYLKKDGGFEFDIPTHYGLFKKNNLFKIDHLQLLTEDRVLKILQNDPPNSGARSYQHNIKPSNFYKDLPRIAKYPTK